MGCLGVTGTWDSGTDATPGSESGKQGGYRWHQQRPDLARTTRTLKKSPGGCLLLLFNFLAMKVPTGRACCHSWDPLSLLHACATRTHICFQLSAYRDQRGRARACAWLQPLPPRSSGGHFPSGKGDDATGGNAMSLRQRRALCQVPMK